MSSEDITVDIMGGARGKNLLKINGGGQTMHGNRVEISNLLIQKEAMSSRAWSFGGVTLHELIRHIHIDGDADDSPAALSMREYFKTRLPNNRIAHPRENRYNRNIKSTAIKERKIRCRCNTKNYKR